MQAERELCQRLKRQITVARRMIRARIEAAVSSALRGPWTQFTGLFEIPYWGSARIRTVVN
ncbi:hypothetical protein [Marivita sp.]|uniref:hypothetical protein n=1 Tax=Marivita sp. TaxID=2003365 RepID=UPI003B5BECC9